MVLWVNLRAAWIKQVAGQQHTAVPCCEYWMQTDEQYRYVYTMALLQTLGFSTDMLLEVSILQNATYIHDSLMRGYIR